MKQPSSTLVDHRHAASLILETAAHVRRVLSEPLAKAGLSLAQYNVLRILHDAGRNGLPTLAIRRQLPEEAPGITRLVDKLENAQLLRRERQESDRREVRCFLTSRGGALLRSLERPIANHYRQVAGGLSHGDLDMLVKLLAKWGAQQPI